MVRMLGAAFLCAAMILSGRAGQAQETQTQESQVQESSTGITWYSRYSEAMKVASEEGKMMFIYFHEPGQPNLAVFDRWLESTQDGATLAKVMVFCAVPSDLRVKIEGREMALLSHSAFQHMESRPGIAMIDFVDQEDETYGHVVSVYPLTSQRRLSEQAVAQLTRLPRGTLTQRSLVLAVCMHRERPRSVTGRWNPILANETQSHSLHQARIRVQGHHNWDSRFHRIVGRMGGAMGAQEVCAESWPGQSLMDAAEECVSSWRGSSGHWQAVSSAQEAFAYDMKRGANGVWYATGIFAR